MRGWPPITLAAALALGTLLGPAAARAGERLEVPALAGWRVTASHAGPAVEMTTLAPESEPAEAWTRRITVQAFRGSPLTVGDFQELLTRRTRELCEEEAGDPPRRLAVAGAEAGLRTIACGRPRDGSDGEVAQILALRGREAFYVVQHSWRLPPFDAARPPLSAQALAEGEAVLRAVTLCDAAVSGRPCAAP